MVEKSVTAQIKSDGDIREGVSDWVYSPSVRDLVLAFGGVPDDVLNPRNLRASLEGLSNFSTRWDTRGGGERDGARNLELDDDLENLVLRCASDLGLMNTQMPSRQEYDYIFLLGGLLRACISRPAYAANLVNSGHVAPTTIVALGGHREFSKLETVLAGELELGKLSDEFDALEFGTVSAFELGDANSVERGGAGNLAWTLKTYVTMNGMVVRVAAAPSADASRRANTPDGYSWFARDVVALKPGDRVLAVTTAIYVPAQHAAALRMLTLPFGAWVETVGMIPGDVDKRLAQGFTPTKYLQEIRSTVERLLQLEADL